MGFLTDIDVPERRTDRRACPHCEATLSAAASGSPAAAVARPATATTASRCPAHEHG